MTKDLTINKKNSNTVLLVIDWIELIIWNVLKKTYDWKIFSEYEQKKSMLYSILQNPNHSRIILLWYMYKILQSNKLHKVKFIVENNNKYVKLLLEWDFLNYIELNKIKISELKKVKEQSLKWKEFKTLEEWILKNLMLFFNNSNEHSNNLAIDFFITMILWKEWNSKITKQNKESNLISYILEYFIKKTKIVDFIELK